MNKRPSAMESRLFLSQAVHILFINSSGNNDLSNLDDDLYDLNSSIENVQDSVNKALLTGYTPSDYNCDNLSQGIYQSSSWENAPNANGFVICFQASANCFIQFNCTYSGNKLSIRGCWYGSWNDWITL